MKYLWYLWYYEVPKLPSCIKEGSRSLAILHRIDGRLMHNRIGWLYARRQNILISVSIRHKRLSILTLNHQKNLIGEMRLIVGHFVYVKKIHTRSFNFSSLFLTFKITNKKGSFLFLFVFIGGLVLEGREAVLHRRRVRVKQLVVQPLLAPPLLVGVQVGARVRLLFRLCLGVEVLVCPALAHDAACGWREHLAVLALDLGRLLVTVQPLARLLDLLGDLALLEALARLDSHEVGVRLHIVGGD